MVTIPDPTKVPQVLTAIAEVRDAINALGIVKGDEVTSGAKFHFRGIDRVLNAFSGPMAVAGLMLIPSYSGLVVTERKTNAGGANFNAVVTGTYTLVSTKDGSVLPLGDFYGEANDTQDKAITKAQSIALRQAYLQTFVVPLGPEADPENSQDDEPAGKPAVTKASLEKPKEGHVVGEELSDNQKTVFMAALKRSALNGKDVKSKFGKVDQGNFTEAMAWAKSKLHKNIDDLENTVDLDA